MLQSSKHGVDIMYQTLLFDLDGTLADSAQGIYRSLGWAMASVGAPKLRRDEVRHFMGTPVEQVLQERFGCDEQTAFLVRTRFLEHYQNNGLCETTAAPGMVALTARLKQVGFRLAIASCKPWIYCGPTLELCGFSECFEAVVGSDHNGVPEVKSAVIREALRLLDAPAETALMIGDRAADVEGAWACGIPCVGVDFCGYADPNELDEAGALRVFQTADALEGFLIGAG